MGWYIVGAGLIVIGVAGLVFGGRLALTLSVARVPVVTLNPALTGAPG